LDGCRVGRKMAGGPEDRKRQELKELPTWPKNPGMPECPA
jgi:hypothetical protein